MVSGNNSNSALISFELLLRLKKARRDELNRLSADDAQALVEGVLHPRLWRIEDPAQLVWPGDWTDDEKGG